MDERESRLGPGRSDGTTPSGSSSNLQVVITIDYREAVGSTRLKTPIANVFGAEIGG